MCTLDGCQTDATPRPTPTDRQRRLFLKGAAALPIGMILADATLVQAAAHQGQTQSLPSGATGFYVAAEKPDAPTLILIHEWWGLNDHIKTMAVEFASRGFNTLAVDMFAGSVASTPKQAMAQIGGLDGAQAMQDLSSWVAWGREQGNGKVATLGWCFGGGWSLKAAANAKPDASVIYYGDMSLAGNELADLKTPLLGHFGTLDSRINAEMVGDFRAELAAAGKEDLLTEHWYTADHAFANPTGGRYDQDDAELALHRSLTFLHQYL